MHRYPQIVKNSNVTKMNGAELGKEQEGLLDTLSLRMCWETYSLMKTKKPFREL